MFLHGQDRDRGSKLDGGVVEVWEHLEGVTGRDGRFEFKFQPPSTYQFYLRAVLAGYAKESWSWSEIRPTQVIDIGTVPLRPGGAIEGLVVDKSGTPLKHRWSIFVDWEIGGQFGEARNGGFVSARSDELTGAFRVEDIPTGTVNLRAHSSLAGNTESIVVDVIEGRTTTMNLVYDGPDFTRRIQVRPSIGPYALLGSLVTDIRIEGPGVDEALTKTPRYGGVFAVEDLADGSYTVSINDENYLPWSKEGVRPGSVVTAKLLGSAGIQLSLTDATHGAQLFEAKVRMRFEDKPTWGIDEFEIHTLGLLPEGGLFPHIPPGDRTLIIEAPGYGSTEVPLGVLVPGEVRQVAAVLLPESSLGGRSHYTDGTDAAGIRVLVMLSGTKAGVRPPVFGPRGKDERVYFTEETDGKGRFHFAKLPPGTYDVYGLNTLRLVGTATNQVVAQGQHRQVNLTVPQGAKLEVTVKGLPKPMPKGFGVFVQTDSEPRIDRGLFGDEYPTLRKGQAELKAFAPGKWLGTNLPPGPVHVYLGRSRIGAGVPGGWTIPKDGYIEPIGEVTLQAGRTERLTLHIGDRAPGATKVVASFQGEPAPNCRVRIYAEGHVPAGCAKTDPDGGAYIDGLFPGAYTVEVKYKGKLTVTSNSPVHVTPGATTPVALPFVGYTNTLVCLDPDGEQIPKADLALDSATLHTYFRAEPNSEHALIPGEYEVECDRYDPELKKSFRLFGILSWPATDGETVVLRLAPL